MCGDEDGFNLSSEAYLEKHQILFYFEDCINQLLQYRDENPKVNTIKFINEYFYSLKCGTHVMFRDFEFINATPHNRISFLKIFWQFFKQIGKKGDLLTVQEYHSLITLICPDLPFDLVQKTARIILLDDALDSLISFADFLYAFQVQFYYQEFIQKCGEIYSVLHCQRSPRDPVVVPTSDIANLHTVSTCTSPPADGVEAISFLRAIMHLRDKKKIGSTFSIPPVQVLQEIFTSTSTSHISFYEFLMALARNEMLNTTLGGLPSKSKVFDTRKV